MKGGEKVREREEGESRWRGGRARGAAGREKRRERTRERGRPTAGRQRLELAGGERERRSTATSWRRGIEPGMEEAG